MIVNGLVTLRSYERTRYFRLHFLNDLEKSTNVTFSYYSILRWTNFYLDCICVLYSLCAVTFAIFSRGVIRPELLAFSIQILGEIVKFFSNTFRQACEIENNFTSSQRLHRYTELESEDLLIKPIDDEINRDDKVWPNEGKIEFSNVTMAYRDGLEPSLTTLSFCVQPRMKVGIVGRTGAGKSSIL